MKKALTILTACLLLSTAAVADDDYDAGIAALKARNYGAAATAFQKYIEKRPEVYQGYLLLGQALLGQGKVAEATRQLNKANELKPGDPNVKKALDAAKAREIRSRARGGSLEALKQVADMSPKDAQARAAYAAGLLNAGQLRPAVAAFETALGLAPNDQRIGNSYINALKQQGRRTQGSGKTAIYNKAVGVAQRMVSANASFDNLLTLGELQLGAKNYGAALTTLQRAQSKGASKWLPLFYIGQAHTAQGNFDAALAPLEQAMTKSGADRSKIQSQLGFVYEKKKEYPKAVAAYQAAGNSAGVARVQQNQEIEAHNEQADAHNQEVEDLQREREALKKAMEELPGSGPPPR